MKGLVPLLEAVAKLRTERDVELTVIGRPTEGGPGRPGHRPARSGRRRALRERDQRRRRSPGSTARPRSPWCRRSTRGSRCRPSRRCPVASPSSPRRAAPCPRWWADTTARRACSCRRTIRVRWPAAIGRLLDDPDLRARLGAAGRAPGGASRFTWQVTAAGTAACYDALSGGTPLPGAVRRGPATRPGWCLADGRLRPTRGRPGDRVLDLGCGFGRHAFEAARRGRVGRGARCRCRRGGPGARHARGHGRGGGTSAGPSRHGRPGRRPGVALRRRHLRPRHRLRGARAHPGRLRRHARAGPRCCVRAAPWR